jgi:2'-5' RNA ligase
MMIESVVEKLKRMGFRASWVPGGNSHLTISFLDSVELQRLELLATMLSKRLRGFPTFTLETGKLGYFKHKELPKVVWIGIERNQTLSNLHREVRSVLESMSFPVEDNFSPPLWNKFLETIETEKIVFQVNEVSVFESILSREGAKYRKVFTCSFEGGLIKHDFQG